MNVIRGLARSPWSYRALRVVGFVLLVWYLDMEPDWRLSLPWALAFPTIAIGVAAVFVWLKLPARFPGLDRYLISPPTVPTKTEKEWRMAKLAFLLEKLRGMIFTPAEDGLLCVPLLLVGVSPVAAAVCGAVFGILHVGAFTYSECLGKAIYYAAACFFVLPHGILTMAAGHALTNIIGLGTLKLMQHSANTRVAL